MKKNMGSADRLIRILLAVIIGILYFTGHISGTAAIILGIVAVAFLLTSIAGNCPMYSPLNISTVKTKPEEPVEEAKPEEEAPAPEPNPDNEQDKPDGDPQ